MQIVMQHICFHASVVCKSKTPTSDSLLIVEFEEDTQDLSPTSQGLPESRYIMGWKTLKNAHWLAYSQNIVIVNKGNIYKMQGSFTFFSELKIIL